MQKKIEREITAIGVITFLLAFVFIGLRQLGFDPFQKAGNLKGDTISSVSGACCQQGCTQSTNVSCAGIQGTFYAGVSCSAPGLLTIAKCVPPANQKCSDILGALCPANAPGCPATYICKSGVAGCMCWPPPVPTGGYCCKNMATLPTAPLQLSCVPRTGSDPCPSPGFPPYPDSACGGVCSQPPPPAVCPEDIKNKRTCNMDTPNSCGNPLCTCKPDQFTPAPGGLCQ